MSIFYHLAVFNCVDIEAFFRALASIRTQVYVQQCLIIKHTEVHSTFGHIFKNSFKEKTHETIARSRNRTFLGKKIEFACHPYIVFFSSLGHSSCRLHAFQISVFNNGLVYYSLSWLFTITKNTYFDFAFLLCLCWETFFPLKHQIISVNTFP